MKEFLRTCEYIDWQSPSVNEIAQELSADLDVDFEVARACFEFVRDEIGHSTDIGSDVVTIRASEVLSHKTGVCYAKSHLLAALLRANGIPSALCYQRLWVENDAFCLHGFNSIFLNDFGWYRVDARGNKAGVDAQFSPPYERLAFKTMEEGEWVSDKLFSEPLPLIVDTMNRCENGRQLDCRLPDAVSL